MMVLSLMKVLCWLLTGIGLGRDGLSCKFLSAASLQMDNNEIDSNLDLVQTIRCIHHVQSEEAFASAVECLSRLPRRSSAGVGIEKPSIQSQAFLLAQVTWLRVITCRWLIGCGWFQLIRILVSPSFHWLVG